MKLKKFAAAVAVLGSILGGASQAAPTILTPDGLKSPFGGFDWSAGAAAWTVNYQGTVGSTFDLYYAAWAVAINSTGSNPLFAKNLDIIADGAPNDSDAYEYTIFAKLSEKITASGASSQTFAIQSGTFDIYASPKGAANARQDNGTGFLDGVKIISGTVNTSTDAFDSVSGGQSNLTGIVTYTNLTYINPALVGTTLTSTLQLASATNFTIPTGFDYDNDGSSDAFGGATPNIVFQADANQKFTTTRVPEPGALLLVGAALGALGLSTRRAKNAA